MRVPCGIVLGRFFWLGVWCFGTEDFERLSGGFCFFESRIWWFDILLARATFSLRASIARFHVDSVSSPFFLWNVPFLFIRWHVSLKRIRDILRGSKHHMGVPVFNFHKNFRRFLSCVRIWSLVLKQCLGVRSV